MIRTVSFSAQQFAFCWGDNQWFGAKTARLGIDGTHSALPTRVLANGTTPLDVAGTIEVGSQHSCVLRNGVKCFGINDRAQLGIGSADTLSHPRPVQVVGMANLLEEEDE